MTDARGEMQSDYMHWFKYQQPVRYNLASSEVPHFRLDQLPLTIGDLDLDGASHYRYPPLRQRIGERYGVDPASIVTANGASMANFLAMATLIGPGDEVIFERPAYQPMLSSARFLGAVIKWAERSADSGFRLDLDRLEQLASSRTRLIVVTNLHNPTGALTAEEDLRAIGAIADRCGVHVLVDEVYLDSAFPSQQTSALLGLRTDEIHLIHGLELHTLHSHLACADEDSAMNAVQRDRFAAVAAAVQARRYSFANSAGICLGPDYAFDLVRPGLALYGGVPRNEAAGYILQVTFPEAEIVQRRTIKAGETCGYGATWTARADTEAAIVNVGYADGYLRCFAGKGAASANGASLPLIGRVSMDLIALDASIAPELAEGDWVTLDYDLPAAAEASGLSQYELLTGLSDRFDRRWV